MRKIITFICVMGLILSVGYVAVIASSSEIDNSDNKQDPIISQSIVGDEASFNLVTVLPEVYKDEALNIFGEDGYWTNVSNAIKYQTTISNKGTVDVYVRTIFAFPASLEFKFNVNNEDWKWEKSSEVKEIDGENYYIYIATCLEVLGSGEVSTPSLLEFVMDKKMTQEENINDITQISIYTSSQASTSKDGFGEINFNKFE